MELATAKVVRRSVRIAKLDGEPLTKRITGNGHTWRGAWTRRFAEGVRDRVHRLTSALRQVGMLSNANINIGKYE